MAPRDNYWSRYPSERLRTWADDLAGHGAAAEAWCVFDNTASGAAIVNALEMSALVRSRRGVTSP